jgi:tetratricopeptide (TPR) repeat protein
MNEALAALKAAIRGAAEAYRAGDLDRAEEGARHIVAAWPQVANGHALLGVVLRARGRFRDSLAAYDAALQRDPNNGETWYNRGNLLRAWRRDAEALESYERALACGHDNRQVRAARGAALLETGRLEAALDALEALLLENPGDTAAALHYGLALQRSGRYDLAVEIYAALVRDEPDNAEALARFGGALLASGREAQAQTVLEQALERDSGNVAAHLALANLYLRRGDYAAGWPHYRWRWRARDAQPRRGGYPEWDGREAAGRTLLVRDEQGFGDTILASRFLAGARRRVGRLVLQCPPALHRLFDGVAGIDALAGPETRPPADMQVHVLDLPELLGVAAPGEVPPPPELAVPEAVREKFADLLPAENGVFRVGIVWSGNPAFTGNVLRAAPLAQFLKLGDIEGVRLHALQKGAPADDLFALGDAGIRDLGPDLTDFADTAAALERLDLVVMADSAVAHLAGTLGRPVWTLLDTTPYWIYGATGERCAWYPSMRLFRQPAPRDWDGVFAAVCAALEEELSRRGSSAPAR